MLFVDFENLNSFCDVIVGTHFGFFLLFCTLFIYKHVYFASFIVLKLFVNLEAISICLLSYIFMCQLKTKISFFRITVGIT